MIENTSSTEPYSLVGIAHINGGVRGHRQYIPFNKAISPVSAEQYGNGIRLKKSGVLKYTTNNWRFHCNFWLEKNGQIITCLEGQDTNGTIRVETGDEIAVFAHSEGDDGWHESFMAVFYFVE